MPSMVCSPVQLARRALVTILLSVAAAYNVAVNVNRNSADDALVRGYRKVILKAHPDKGGRAADAQSLQAAKDGWETAKRNHRPRGRPKGEAVEQSANQSVSNASGTASC